MMVMEGGLWGGEETVVEQAMSGRGRGHVEGRGRRQPMWWVGESEKVRNVLGPIKVPLGVSGLRLFRKRQG